MLPYINPSMQSFSKELCSILERKEEKLIFFFLIAETNTEKFQEKRKIHILIEMLYNPWGEKKKVRFMPASIG